MTARLFFAIPGKDAMTGALAPRLDGEVGPVDMRALPDGETYLWFLPDPAGRALVLSAHDQRFDLDGRHGRGLRDHRLARSAG
jgi:hypothetical protein